MKIATNIPALQANMSLSKIGLASSSASKKLSSGLKINVASDDLTGMAISARMKAQIRGSSRAGQNTLDGISLVQTADGAMQEVHDMLQRMRELAVQSANATYTQDDLEKIQMEIDELKDEINSISEKTEFNKAKLLDGTSDLQTMGINADVVSVTDTMKTGDYKFNIIGMGSKSLYVTNPVADAESIFPDSKLSGTITINEMEVKILSTDTLATVYKRISELADKCDLVATESSDGSSALFIEAKEAGSKHAIEISSSNKMLLDALGMNNSASYTLGKDAVIELTKNSTDPSSVVSDSATYKADGNEITVVDIDNQKLVFELDPTDNDSYFQYVLNLRQEIINRWDIVDQTHNDIVTLQGQLNSISNSNDVIAFANELKRLEDIAVKASTEAKELMFEAVRRYPELENDPAYSSESANLTGHDSHYVVDFYTNSEKNMNSAKTKAANNDLAGAITDLSIALVNGMGSKMGGGGVGGCSFEIANSALNIVKNLTSQAGNFEEGVVKVSDGGLILQVGANEGMQLKMNLARVSTQALDVDDIKINTYDRAQEAIMKCDYAIGRVSNNRAMIGSYQNRLTHTELNLSSIEFNLSKSLSTIQDTNVAQEMAELTRNNVLEQAGMFVLSQANQKPQELLQLLK